LACQEVRHSLILVYPLNLPVYDRKDSTFTLNNLGDDSSDALSEKKEKETITVVPAAKVAKSLAKIDVLQEEYDALKFT